MGCKVRENPLHFHCACFSALISPLYHSLFLSFSLSLFLSFSGKRNELPRQSERERRCMNFVARGFIARSIVLSLSPSLSVVLRMSLASSALLSSSSSAPASSSSSSSSSSVTKTRPLIVDGHYQNPASFQYQQRTLMEVIRWQCSRPKGFDPTRGLVPSRDLPIVQPQFLSSAPSSFSSSSSVAPMCFTWLSHASGLIQIDGLNILIDPVFTERPSPVSFVGPKRLVPLVCSVDALPRVDLICISHTHFDHLSYQTLKELVTRSKRLEQPLRFVCGKNVERWLSKHLAIEKSHILELEWWETVLTDFPFVFSSVSTSSSSPKKDSFVPVRQIKIIATPAKHWSNRIPFDSNNSLWVGFAIEFAGRRVYYSGDTSFCHVFAEIGAHLGPFDLALLPIGAYSPRDFMIVSHCNPEEAVQIAEDVNAKQSIALHWGTFVLSDEDVMEPKTRLEAEVKRRRWPEKKFACVKHGETVLIE